MVMWKPGAVLGISPDAKAITLLRGVGRLDFNEAGAHVSGDATADGKGGVSYSNVASGTTTSDYWDGTKTWKAGAILGPVGHGKRIGVVSGTVLE